MAKAKKEKKKPLKFRLLLKLGDYRIGFLIPEDAADMIRNAEREAEPDDLYIVQVDAIPEDQDPLTEVDDREPITIDDLPETSH